MKIRCIWEHNGSDSLIYAADFAGAFTRGDTKETALDKMKREIRVYQRWRNGDVSGEIIPEIVQEKPSDLRIADADSDVLFETERSPLSMDEYLELKQLALKSAGDFLRLYEAVPDKDKSSLPERTTFYGTVPRTAREMYEHTKNVNEYYFGEIGVEVDNEGTILACREKGFQRLEEQQGFLENTVLEGSYGEEWSLRKVLRRFIWHDRIHAKAMYRMALKTFEEQTIPDIFRFEEDDN